MRPRTLLALFGAVALLGAFIWLFERDVASTDRRRELEQRLFGVEAGDVSGLTIETTPGRAVLRREGGGWQLLEPFDALADAAEVDRLARSIAELEHSRTLEEWEPAAVGLDRPRARVSMTTADAELTLEIGAAVPTTETMIVAVAGTDVARVVPGGVWDLVQRPPGDWRSRHVLSTARVDIASLQLIGEAGSVELTRRDGRFHISSPIEDLADPQLVGDLLASIEGLQVSQFVDDVPAGGTGLDAARERLLVITGSGEEETLELGSSAGADRYARVGKRSFVVDASSLDEAWSRSGEDWRSTDWLDLAVYDVERVEAVSDDGEVSVSRSEGEWRRGEELLEASAINDFLYALDEARAESFATAAPQGEPRLVVALTDRAGESVSLELYEAGPDGRSPAVADGRAATLLLSAEAARRVFDALLALGE